MSAVLVVAAPAPGTAQDSGQMRALMDKIERLQGELNDLQRAVYKGEVPEERPGAASSGDSGDAGGTASASDATGMQPLPLAAGRRMRERISALENELRGLTGKVQETRHKLDKMAQRLDKLTKDIEYRLKTLEEFQRSAAKRLDKLEAATGASAATATGSADDRGDGGQTGDQGQQAAQAQGQTGGATAGAGGDGSGPGKLGTVSEEAVAELREEARQQKQQSGGGNGDGDTQTAAKANGSELLPDAKPRAQYDAAFELLQAREFAKAEKALGSFLDAHPEHKLAGNAKYWLGETHYVRGNYKQAAVVFAEGFRTYPNSRKAPDNLLKLGITLGEIDKVDKACSLFSELQSRFPDAPKNILRRAEKEQAELGCESG